MKVLTFQILGISKYIVIAVGFFTVGFFFLRGFRILALTSVSTENCSHSTVPCRSFGLHTPKHLGIYGDFDETDPQITMELFHKKESTNEVPHGA